VGFFVVDGVGLAEGVGRTGGLIDRVKEGLPEGLGGPDGFAEEEGLTEEEGLGGATGVEGLGEVTGVEGLGGATGVEGLGGATGVEGLGGDEGVTGFETLGTAGCETKRSNTISTWLGVIFVYLDRLLLGTAGREKLGRAGREKLGLGSFSSSSPWASGLPATMLVMSVMFSQPVFPRVLVARADLPGKTHQVKNSGDLHIVE
jgi:hypothetical protein